MILEIIKENAQIKAKLSFSFGLSVFLCNFEYHDDECCRLYKNNQYLTYPNFYSEATLWGWSLPEYEAIRSILAMHSSIHTNKIGLAPLTLEKRYGIGPWEKLDGNENIFL